jgi:hypothetical protein
MRKQKALAGHEQVYHAALRRQGKRSGLTPQRLRGEKKPCPATGKKEDHGSLFYQREPSKPAWIRSGDPFGVGELSVFKGLSLIARLTRPHAIHNAHPNVGQSRKHSSPRPFLLSSTQVGAKVGKQYNTGHMYETSPRMVYPSWQ